VPIVKRRNTRPCRPAFVAMAFGWVTGLGVAASSTAACKIEQVAEFRVDLSSGSPLMDGSLNGQPIRVLIGTGSLITYLTMPAARRLNLQVHEYKSLTMATDEGNVQIESALIRNLRLGQLPMDARAINVVGGEIRSGDEVASLVLGADFFSHYTTEFDFAHNAVRLLKPKDCKLEQMTYWSPEFYRAELVDRSVRSPGFSVQVKLNGAALEAKFDTESPISFISLDGAKAAGVGPDSPGVQAGEPYVDGPTQAQVPTWTGQFNTFEVGNETIRYARVRMGDVLAHREEAHTGSLIGRPLDTTNEVVVGSDFFRAHRVLIVPDQGAVLFTYNGSPIY
jgi:hypothetical protein